MSPLHCRCGAFVADEVVHLDDTADGFYVVTEAPLADHVHACRCGTDWIITSTQSVVVHHPGQMTLIRGAA